MFTRKITPNEMDQLIKMQAFVRNAHADSDSHDYAHILTVCRYGIQIARNIEEHVDPYIVIAACLLHDIGKTNEYFGHLHGLLGGALAEEFLEGLGVPEELQKPICNAIIRHTPTSMISPTSAVEKIVFDADTLDRLGLMGLLRGFIGKKGSMNSILTNYMERRLQDYDKLHFEFSKQMGDSMNEEIEAYIAIVNHKLQQRMQTIEHIFETENLV
jgi:putative nucleotidyltransferase with HDIG domain